MDRTIRSDQTIARACPCLWTQRTEVCRAWLLLGPWALPFHNHRRPGWSGPPGLYHLFRPDWVQAVTAAPGELLGTGQQAALWQELLDSWVLLSPWWSQKLQPAPVQTQGNSKVPKCDYRQVRVCGFDQNEWVTQNSVLQPHNIQTSPSKPYISATSILPPGPKSPSPSTSPNYLMVLSHQRCD